MGIDEKKIVLGWVDSWRKEGGGEEEESEQRI